MAINKELNLLPVNQEIPEFYGVYLRGMEESRKVFDKILDAYAFERNGNFGEIGVAKRFQTYRRQEKVGVIAGIFNGSSMIGIYELEYQGRRAIEIGLHHEYYLGYDPRNITSLVDETIDAIAKAVVRVRELEGGGAVFMSSPEFSRYLRRSEAKFYENQYSKT